MSVQRHSVVIPREDGGVEVHPLKQWLRQHPDQIPPGLDATSSTSHQLRAGLRRLGWTLEETPTEVRLIKPGASGTDVTEVLGSVEEQIAPEEAESYFSLEYQLRDFIATNIGTLAIGGSRLRLFVDPSGRDGVEYPSAVGPMDILATDDAGALYVFELKRANSPDKAVGQLARYMGWVRQTIGNGRRVVGVVVAKSISDNLRYAASVIPDVHLFEYEVEFRLRSAHDLPET